MNVIANFHEPDPASQIELTLDYKAERFGKSYRLVERNDSIFFYTFNPTLPALNRYYLHQTEFVFSDAILLDSTVLDADYFKIVEDNKLIIFSYEKSSFSLLDLSTGSVKTWKTQTEIDGLPYYVTMFSDIEGFYYGDTLDAYAYPYVGDYMEKYQLAANYTFTLDTTGSLNPIKKKYSYPSYVDKTNFNRSTPLRIVSPSGDTYFAFTAMDSIYKLDKAGKTIAKKLEVEGWRAPDNLVWDSLKNSSYMERYFSEQPKLVRILYSEARNHLYIAEKQSQQYHNPDGSINLMVDAPWSIVILDTQLNKVNQVNLPAKSYFWSNIHVYKDGILVCKEFSFDSDSNKTHLVFEFIKL